MRHAITFVKEVDYDHLHPETLAIVGEMLTAYVTELRKEIDDEMNARSKVATPVYGSDRRIAQGHRCQGVEVAKNIIHSLKFAVERRRTSEGR